MAYKKGCNFEQDSLKLIEYINVSIKILMLLIKKTLTLNKAKAWMSRWYSPICNKDKQKPTIVSSTLSFVGPVST